MEQDQNQPVNIQDVLSRGGSIHYAPVQGGMLILDEAGDRVDCPLSMADFLRLQDEGVVALSSTMRQGHGFFHGQVNIYSTPSTAKK